MRTKAELEYIKTAKEIEAEFGVKVCVIKRNPTSPIEMITSGGKYTLFIVAPFENTHSTLLKVRKKFPYLGIQQTLPVEEFVQLAKSKPGIIKINMGGDRLIPPFFFHEEIYGNYAKNFRKTLRKELGGELDTAIKERLARFGINSPKDYAKRVQMLRRAIEIQTKIVGPKEHKYLVKELARMAQEIKDSDAEVLILFDRAARYLAQPLKKILARTHQKKPLVFFVDPEIVRMAERDLTLNRGTKIPYSTIKALFEKEFPKLVQTISGKRVILVDDQSCSGRAKNGMERLISQYNPKTLNYTHLSTVDTAPQPSWREQGLYSIESRIGSFRVKRAKVDATKKRQIKGLRLNLNRVANRIIRGRR
jgi:pyrimidine operon attenuation protein/uracil phosphoribosyltransferase